MFWTDSDNRNFIREFYPDHLHVYDSYKKNIQRVDFVRVLYLYHYGGLYVDLDFECKRSNIPLLLNHSLVLASEPSDHARSQKRNRMLCNAWMASTPKHPFWLAVLHEMHHRSHTHSDKVLLSTGPLLLDDVFTMVYRQGFNDFLYSITILPSELIYPKIADADKKIKDPSTIIQYQQRFQNAFAIHHWKNSWVNAKKNSFPHLPGFTFYPGLDDVSGYSNSSPSPSLVHFDSNSQIVDSVQSNNQTNPNKSIPQSLITRSIPEITQQLLLKKKKGFFTNGKEYYLRNVNQQDDEKLEIQWPSHIGGWYSQDFPHGFPTFDGYDTLLFFDAPGYDLTIRKTKDLSLIKQLADSDPSILGFNSDGALKLSLRSLQPQKMKPICFYRKQKTEPLEIIPGFLFYPHLDSPGNDIERWTHSKLIQPKSNFWSFDPHDWLNLPEIQKLIDMIRDKPYCTAFNLDGNLKSTVLPQDKWRRSHPFAFQGLFVRKSISI